MTGVVVIETVPNKAVDTWHGTLQKEPFGQDWDLQITITGSPDQILADIREGTVVAVSDGSYQHSMGAAAWIIEGATSSNRIQGTMLTPGNPSNHSAFWSEVAGLYGILLTLQRLLATDPMASGQLDIACDGHSVLDHLQSKKSINPFAAHADLLNACQQMEQLLPCQVTYLHIKGHQDNGYPTVLSRLAWLSIEVDLAAKARIDVLYKGKAEYRIPNEVWHIEIAGQ